MIWDFLPEPHYAAVSASREPGVWLVFCTGCSKQANDYVYPCAEGREFPPLRLVAKQK